MCKIALVDDYLRIRETIAVMIKQLNGYSVSIEASNGYELLEQLNSSKELPDIAILDVQMPVMDGVATTNYLVDHYPNIKILAISFHVQPTIIQDILHAGASGYMVKENLSSSSLLKAFTVISEGKYFIDQSLNNKEVFELAVNRWKVSYTEHPEITKREKIFLQLSATAISYDQIANLMNVAKESIYNYQKSLKEKIGLSSRQELMQYAIQYGIAKVARYNN